MACTHDDFESSVLVKRLPPPSENLLPAYLVHIRVRCEACQAQLTFALPLMVGLGMVRDAEQSPDGTEARLRANIAVAPVEIPGGWTRTQTTTTDEG